MKICLISSGYIQNDPRYYFLANSFKKAGHKVILVNILLAKAQVPKSKNYKIFRLYDVLNIDFYNYIPDNLNVEYQNFFTGYIDKLIPSFVKTYIQKNTKEGFLKADLFYGLEMFFGGIIAQQFAKETRKDFIVDFKELFSEMEDYTEETLAIINNIEKQFINNSVLIPCVSQKIIDFYKSKYSDSKEKFVLLENSRPFDNLTPIFSNPKRTKAKFIVSAGSACEERGFNELAQIWETLNPNNATLDIRASYITEEQKNKILSIAQKTYGKSLNFIPPVLEDELTKSLLGYDCGIIPYLPEKNLNQRYCCPNKFGQYMNAGLAVVSSNTEYITERIVQHDLGIIYDPTDIEGSVKKFQALIDDPVQLAAKRLNAYNFCKEDYEWNNHVTPLLNRLKLLPLKSKPNIIGAILHFFGFKGY